MVAAAAVRNLIDSGLLVIAPPRPVFTAYEDEIVLRMRGLRASWDAVAKAVGHSTHDVRVRYDADYLQAGGSRVIEAAEPEAPAPLLTPLGLRKLGSGGPCETWPGKGTVGAKVLAAVDGRRDVTAIAGRAGISRNSAFSMLSQLSARGLVVNPEFNGIRYLTPKGVDHLEALRG